MKPTIIHNCLDVAGCLRRSTRELTGLFKRHSGAPVTGYQARQYLLAQQAKGVRVLPVGEPCAGFSYQTGCPGHQEAPDVPPVIPDLDGEAMLAKGGGA